MKTRRRARRPSATEGIARPERQHASLPAEVWSMIFTYLDDPERLSGFCKWRMFTSRVLMSDAGLSTTCHLIRSVSASTGLWSLDLMKLDCVEVRDNLHTPWLNTLLQNSKALEIDSTRGIYSQCHDIVTLIKPVDLYLEPYYPESMNLPLPSRTLLDACNVHRLRTLTLHDLEYVTDRWMDLLHR